MVESGIGLGQQSDGVDADLDDLVTEAGGDPHSDYESRSTLELVRLMNEVDAAVPGAVAAAANSIATAVDAVTERLRAGGRLVYVGAGSSGRIAALDASECESTFSTPPGTVVALVAGGITGSPLEQSRAEDDEQAGEDDIVRLDVGARDAVIGVSASGRTPYVLGAMRAARRSGALTACVVSVTESALATSADHEIAVVVGPEFLVGSTRLKAGTAQKLVLNTISTLAMVRLGKTYGNLMVDVAAANEKLQARVRRIVATATGAAREEVDDALRVAGGEARVAIVSLLTGLDATAARSKLDEAGQSIRRAVET